jgi:hypothetical protein
MLTYADVGALAAALRWPTASLRARVSYVLEKALTESVRGNNEGKLTG